MLPVLQIGPLALQTPGLILVLGAWLGLMLSERLAGRSKVPASAISNLAMALIISAAVGARLAYIVRYPAVFSKSPIDLVSLNPGLLDAWGGAAAALLVGMIYGQKKKLQFWPVMDALTPALAGLAVAIHLSHLASGRSYGAPADLPWTIELWGADRHPAQIYEAAAALVILFITWPWRKRSGAEPDGVRFLLFVTFNAAARLFLEAYRGDSAWLPGGLRSAQVAAWLLLAFCLWLLLKRIQPPPTTPVQSAEQELKQHG